MLEQLFGSRTRTKLLRLFLMHPEQAFFIRELTRMIDTQINSVRRELQNLLESGVIIEVVDVPHGDVTRDGGVFAAEGRKKKQARSVTEKQPKKFFQVNKDFALHKELQSLFARSPRLVQKTLERELESLGNIDYAVLTGFFTDRDDVPVDLLLVGTVLKSRLAKLIHSIEKDLEREINYSTMTIDEFNYRKSIIDRFLFSILEGKKIIILDRMSQK